MPTKKPFRNFPLLIITIIILFILLEAILAMFWPHKVLTQPYHEQYHPVMGWVNKPFMEGDVQVTHGVFFHRKHNSRGLRSTRHIDYVKPRDVRRVLLLGDSFFWGYGVNDEDIISEVLQNKVSQNIEIINGAVSGYGTDQHLLWLAEEGLKYRPDLVVLGTFPPNDRTEIATSLIYGYPKPYFSLINGNLTVQNIPVPDTRETRRKGFGEPDTWFGKLKKFLRRNTHTYQFIVGRLNSVRPLRVLFLEVGLAEEYTRELPGIPHVRLKKEKIEELSDALMKEIQKIAYEAGAEFLIVHIPKKELLPDSHERDAEAYAWNTELSNHLSAFTSENNINFLDLLPVVRSHQAKGEYLYTPQAYDHHWTPLGHKVAAEAIYEWMRKNGY